MTREEAKEIIANTMFIGSSADDIDTAINMAIEALEREPSISEDGTLTVNVEDGSKVSRVLVCGDNHFGGLYYPDQELCEDAISRQAAIDAIYACYIGGKEAVYKAPVNDLYAEGIYEAVCAVEDLPSVSTEKTGHWIYICNSEVNGLKIVKCSECGKRTYGSGKYCPNCGARMRKVGETE